MYYFKNIEASQLSGARAYFTDIDHRIVSLSSDKKTLERNAIQKLKVLLLTKNTVSTGATHLATEFAYKLFKENPILLNEGLITPALRIDLNDFSELFNNKKVPTNLQNEMVQFYHDNVKQVIRWEHSKNSDWFKETLIKDLDNKGSVIRNNLSKVNSNIISDISTKIKDARKLSRETIESAISKLDINDKFIFRNYRELLYNISGARIVNCESSLPQENYIDYSLTNLTDRKVILSEVQIFKKLLLETTFESIRSKPLNIEVLDYLSFADIIELRKIIDNTEFKDYYDNLVNSTISSIASQSEDSLLNFEELFSIRKNLQLNFKDKIDNEIDVFFKKLKQKKKITNKLNFGKGTFSIGLGVAGLFNTIPSLIGILIESPAYFMNAFKLIRKDEDIRFEKDLLEHRKGIMQTIINKNDFKEKTILSDYVSEITNYVMKDLVIE